MAKTAQISKAKRQSIITLRHESQSIRNISRSLTVSSSAVAKSIKRYDETGSHKDRQRKGRPRVTSAAEDKLSYQPKEMLYRVQVTDTSISTAQRRLSESGHHGRIVAKKPLLKDTNKKERLAWAKKLEQWTLDRWKSVLLPDEIKFEIFRSNCQ